MSRKNSLNGPDLQHRKQPIHFYASSRGSLDDVRNGYCPIDFMTSPLSYVSSPSKYDSQKISPQKANKSITLIRSPQASINVDRVMNSSVSSKYTRLSSKIELLQKNLNRLNGQHQSLKDMFSKSQQLSKCLQVYVNIDKLKQKLQESKTNKYIQQKRYEARFQIIYEDYHKKFTQIKKQLVVPQSQQIRKLQQQVKQSKSYKKSLDSYTDAFQAAKKNLNLINQNANRFLNEINESLKKESVDFMNKKQVVDLISHQGNRINEKIQLVKIKLGQLKCITEYQMHLEKRYFFTKNCPQLNQSNKTMQEFSQSKINELQLDYMKEQMNFVGLETLDRLTYKLSSIDSNLVKILQKYEYEKHKKIQTPKRKKQPELQSPNKDKKECINWYQKEVQSIKKQIQNFNNQMSGLKAFMENSQQKFQRMKKNYLENYFTQKIRFQNYSQGQNIKNYNKIEHLNEYKTLNYDINESIIDLQEKIKLLEENLHFFSINCL